MQLSAAFVRPTLGNLSDSAGRNELELCDIMASNIWLKASFPV